METAVKTHRKLIDIKVPVMNALSLEAQKRQVSLKKYIEDMLEESVYSGKSFGSSEFSPAINRIIGSAKIKGMDLDKIQDDRLQYLLSK